MMQTCIPPSRWWRRRKEIRITIWPTWLAQWLCPHLKNKAWMWNEDGSVFAARCEECNKFIKVKV